MKTKTCVHCSLIRPITEFHKKASNSDGYSGICKDCRRKYNNQWRKNNLEHVREYDRNNTRKIRSCPKARLWKNVTSRISTNRKKNNYLTRTIGELIGCDKETFYDHIEKQFAKDMSWNNYGKYWELDHMFDLYKVKTADEFAEANHYTNLRPYPVKDNRRKHLR